MGKMQLMFDRGKCFPHCPPPELYSCSSIMIVLSVSMSSLPSIIPIPNTQALRHHSEPEIHAPSVLSESFYVLLQSTVVSQA